MAEILSHTLLKKGVWMYLFSFVIAPLWYMTKILISGEISVSELGILYGVISLITLLSAFSDLWVSESLKHFIPQYRQKKEFHHIKSILFYSLIIQMFSWCVLAWFFFFWADFIAEKYFTTDAAENILRIFSLFFIGINIFQMLSSFFLACENTLYFKLCEFIRHIGIFLSVIILIFWWSPQLSDFAWSWIMWLYIAIGFALVLFLYWYASSISSAKILWSKKLWKTFFSYAALVFLSVQAGVILSQIDMQMIIFLLSVESAGYYSVYLSLIMIPFFIITPLFSLLLPTFSRLWGNNQEASIMHLKRQLTNIFTNIALFFSLFFFIFAHEIAFVFFGESYIFSWDILRYSCLFLISNILLQINFNILWWMWKIRCKLYITLIACLWNAFLNIIFLSLLWVAGAALATGIGWVCIWIMSERCLPQKYHILNHYQDILSLKSILLLFFLATISYMFGKDIWENLWRSETFLMLWIYTSIWAILFLCCP